MKIKILRVIDEPFHYFRGDLKEYITERSCEVEINGENRGLYGYPSIEEIYNSINKNQSLYYPHCVIEDFSLDDYKKKYSLNVNGEVRFKDTTFTRSIFILKRNKIIDFYNAYFEGHLSFFSTIFCDGDINFSYCEFTEPEMTDFCGATFGNGDKLFSATFHSDYVNFARTRFGNGKIQFTEATFKSKKISFSYSEFENGEILFDEIEFVADRIDFSNCKFGKCDLNFVGSDFGDGEICFENSNCISKNILFCETRFGVGGLDFSNADMPNAKLDFEEAQFGDLDIKFNNIKCKALNFNKAYLFGDIFWDGARIKQSLSFLDFRVDGNMYIDLAEINLKKLIYNQSLSFKEKAKQFLLLKKNFHKLGYFNDEDEIYVEFKRCEAKSKLEFSNKTNIINKFVGYSKYYCTYFLFDFIGGYGTKPKSVFKFMVLVVLGLAPIYAFVPDFLKWDDITKHFCNISFFNKLLIGLYHSMITFLTIGYGDVAPKSVWGSLLSGLEGFLGLFLMAYFTIAFSRKVLR